MGGVVEACCLQPIDVIKTRLQLDHVGRYKGERVEFEKRGRGHGEKNDVKKKTQLSTSTSTSSKKKKGIYHCGATIVKEEGITALWKGLTPFATHLTLKYALRMGTNALYSSALRDGDGQLSNGRRMLSGMLAGVTEALCIVTPFEVVKIRLQQQKGTTNLQYRGPVHAAATILRQEGLRGLWSGAAPTVARNGTNQMCLFAAKNQFDRLYWGKHEGDVMQLSPLQSMGSGFSAACIGWVGFAFLCVLFLRGREVEAGVKKKTHFSFSTSRIKNHQQRQPRRHGPDGRHQDQAHGPEQGRRRRRGARARVPRAAARPGENPEGGGAAGAVEGAAAEADADPAWAGDRLGRERPDHGRVRAQGEVEEGGRRELKVEGK